MNLVTAKTIAFNQNIAKEVWLNGIKIWSEGFWSFPTPPSGRTITGFYVTTDPSGTILVDWGDNTSNTINSGSLVNKTY